MSNQRQLPVHEPVKSDGLAAMAILLLTIALLAFAAYNILA